MKRIGKPWFFVVALVILALSYLTFFGLYKADGTAIIKGVKDIRWGIDIQGGVNVTFGPTDDELEEITQAEIKAVEQTLKSRLVNNGVTDHDIYVDSESKRFIVSFPWADKSKDAGETINELGATAQLLFIEGGVDNAYLVEPRQNEDGSTVIIDSNGVSHLVAFDGRYVKIAEVGSDQHGNIAVDLTFTTEGGRLFRQTTERLAAKPYQSLDRYLCICLDGQIVSQAHVEQVIDGGKTTISKPNGFSGEEATQLINYVNSGALPFTLETKGYEIMDATMGENSLNAMMIAGIIAFILICIFMIAYYRLPGAVACIALLGQAAGSLAAVSGFFSIFKGFTLTLPGIAGIILSIGMGVDANIITNERIIEEIRKGKTVPGAIAAGNTNSFSSIFDGNITVIIVSIILMGVFGPPDSIWSTLLTPFLWMFPKSTTGAIYSFGYTLLAGVVFNFIMGVTASRLMLTSLSQFNPLRNRKLYGGNEK